jgi:hypothetical protein
MRDATVVTYEEHESSHTRQQCTCIATETLLVLPPFVLPI